jgi:hypothetical protein
MIKKSHTIILAVLLLTGCSGLDKLQGIASCPGWVPEDRTCDVSQQVEYRSDSLHGPGLVVIKEY